MKQVLREPKNLGDLTAGVPLQKIALIDLLDRANPREVTYGELDALSRRVACGLLAEGFSVGDRIAILSENRTEYIAAYLGIMRAGMIAVPISFRLPKPSIEYALQAADVSLCFVDEACRALLPPDFPMKLFSNEGARGFGGLLRDGDFKEFEAGRDDIAMILFTSGSSGRPKAVPLSHAGQLWAVRSRVGSMKNVSEHRFIVAAPLFHMNALFAVKFILFGGASAVLLPKFEAVPFIEAIDTYKVTWLTSVPTMMAMVAREREALARADLSSVRTAAMGSAPVTDSLIKSVKAIFPNANVVLNYGTTEGGAAVFGNHPEGIPRPLRSIGYPLPDIDIRMRRNGKEVPDEGVLEIKTPAQFASYIGLNDASRKALTDDGYYITGDIVRKDQDGFYYFVGRTDEMFVCGGENVFPEEVEIMLERHPDVRQACVVPVPDDIKGMKPVAFVVLREGTALDEESIKRFALENGPAFQHPRRVFQLPAMPLAGTNKIDRKLLRAKAAELANTETAA